MTSPDQHMSDHAVQLSTERGSRRAVVVMARAPIRGAVKTRLAAEIGPDAALAAHRALGARAARACAAVRECERVVAFTPLSGEAATREWLGPGFAYESQVGADLGARMASAVANRWAAGAELVVVIGTDCPTLGARTLEQAFAALDGGAEVVVGPAEDGGYYLIGLRRSAKRQGGRSDDEVFTILFQDVPWSSPETLAVTLARAQERGVRVALLAVMRDVDTAADYRLVISD